MAISSQDICNAADQLKGVGFHGKRGTHIVRFSEDAFGMDVADDSITPCSEFVWRPKPGSAAALCRERPLLLDQHVDDRLNIGEPLRRYRAARPAGNRRRAAPALTARQPSIVALLHAPARLEAFTVHRAARWYFTSWQRSLPSALSCARFPRLRQSRSSPWPCPVR
jgi:hypothetical protein